jgi:HSP20 family molecular chaperone IbpA
MDVTPKEVRPMPRTEDGIPIECLRAQPGPTGEDPGGTIDALDEQLDRMVALMVAPLTGAAEEAPWTPTTAVSETPEEVVIRVELSGVPVDAIEISASKYLLRVSGTRPLPKLSGVDCRLRLMGAPLGPFRQLVALPPGLLPENMQVATRDGLLEVRIPRRGRESQATISTN